MSVYIVIKNHQPCLTTYSEEEAHDLFDSFVHSGCFRQAALHAMPKSGYRKQLLLEACQGEPELEERHSGSSAA